MKAGHLIPKNFIFLKITATTQVDFYWIYEKGVSPHFINAVAFSFFHWAPFQLIKNAP